MTNYIVATTKPWNVRAFAHHSIGLPGSWTLVQDPAALTSELLDRLQPRYVFFPHWSWTVGPAILERAECVCFHAADVPYGRGGSPIQNLIARGHRDTMLTALRMVGELDAGPVYLKRSLSLAGRGQEIFERMADLVWEMISNIVRGELNPSPQQGQVVVFPRRRPEESGLPTDVSLAGLYDHIRMLDVATYPRAFLQHGDFRLEFSHAALQDGRINARVTIRLFDDGIAKDNPDD